MRNTAEADLLEIVDRAPVAGAPHVERLRVRMRDGAMTTAHVARHARSAVTVRLEHLEPARPVAEWAEEQGIPDALSGGFFVKPERVPLGELRISASQIDCRPFESPWDGVRACVALQAGGPRVAPRDEVHAEDGDQLLQAGPLLVAAGEVVVADHDPEGFSTTQHEFDQDLTAERLPRVALGLSADAWLVVAVDGRSEDDAGLLLGELGALLVTLGAVEALNLDGGSSSALVAGGRMRNTPRDDEGEELRAAQATPTAIVFERAS